MKKTGTVKQINDVSSEYRRLATKDEQVAMHLASISEYQHAIYFAIQAMEKYIRAQIFSIVNPNLDYFREKNKSHSLTNAIDFLVQILSTNSLVQESIRKQLVKDILCDINYSQLHNNLRYPFYSKHKETYQSVSYSKEDYVFIENALKRLKKYLADLEVKTL